MHDPTLADRAYIAPSRDGHHWHIRWHHQPTHLRRYLFTSHTLIVMEQSDGPYEPVGIASSQDEALDLISHDYHRRKPENDDLCPESYTLWNRDANGHYRRDATITKA